MKTFNYKGYSVTVFSGYNGDELFITKAGESIYSARVSKGQAQGRVKAILG